MIGRRSISAIGPPRREATICIRSSLLEDTNAGAGHITADWANHLLVLPMPGGAKQPTCGADSNGTRRPWPSRVQPANGVTAACCGASLRLAMTTLQRYVGHRAGPAVICAVSGGGQWCLAIRPAPQHTSHSPAVEVSVETPPKAVGHESENALSAASTHTRLKWLQPWVWIAD
jgi:hypothetical protein